MNFITKYHCITHTVHAVLSIQHAKLSTPQKYSQLFNKQQKWYKAATMDHEKTGIFGS